MKKTIVICNFPRFSEEIWLPTFWAQAKTYYEKNGKNVDAWTWYPSYLDIYNADHLDKIKEQLLIAKPDIFAVSLYVWNYRLANEVAAWVKQQWPHCLIVTGGPHQYFKHNMDWFQQHPYIDASLPGDCYGELCIQEILDNYNDGKVDWTKVTDIRYPKGKSRLIGFSPQSMPKEHKKKFDYDWASFSDQLSEIKKFVEYKNTVFPKSQLMSIIETTRGCPYGCTYCDWGGGIATTVIKKSVENVKRDVDALSNFKLHLLYLADANFGIFGNRDIEIINYIAEVKMVNGMPFKIFYGGFAKTENKLDVVRQIVEIDLNNKLSHHEEIKISIQSLDDAVLKNIDRINIPYDKQLATFTPIAKNKKIPMYGEIIMGLPGITLDKFYTELGIFAESKLSIQWYPWILLPEAPSYAAAYRNTHGIQTVIKPNGWFYDETGARYEIVVGANSYTTTDYMEMLLSTSMYNLIVQGGYYKRVMDWVCEKNNLSVGQLIQILYQEFFLKDPACTVYSEQVKKEWVDIIGNDTTMCSFDINGNEIYGSWYFVALAFLEHEKFSIPLINWLQSRYNVPNKITEADHNVAVHSGNFQKTVRHGINFINYKKNIASNDVNAMINLFRLYRHSGEIFAGTKKFLGILPLR